jgi:hypothetical protein
MKASDAQFNRFRSEWPRRARAGKTRWFFVGAACLVTWVRVIAAQVPTVTIDQASQVTGASALISGTVNANGLATWAWFRWLWLSQDGFHDLAFDVGQPIVASLKTVG